MGYVSHLSCSVCGATYPAKSVMNLCQQDGRPLQMVIDLKRLKAEVGADGWWNPQRRDLWRFGGLLPLSVDDPADRAAIVTLGEGCTPCLPYAHPLADRLGCRLEVKDEGKPYAGFGANPTLSFKDRGMAMTVSMARSLGLKRLAVPTQGNAGDSLAEYAVAAGIEAVIVLSPDTDLPVLGKVAAYAHLYPENVKMDIVPGTIIDCGKRIKEHYLPQGYFSVATFQEPWLSATDGKENARTRDGGTGRRPSGRPALAASGRNCLPDRWRHRGRRHGQGIRRARGVGTGGARTAANGLRSESGQHANCPGVRVARCRHRTETTRTYGRHRIECGAEYRAHQCLSCSRSVRSGGYAIAKFPKRRSARPFSAPRRARRFAWSPEGAATLAALPELADRGIVRPNDRVVLVNTAAAEKYLPTIRPLLDGGL